MSGSVGGHSVLMDTLRRSASGAVIDTTSLISDESWTGCSLSSSGRANFRKPTTT